MAHGKLGEGAIEAGQIPVFYPAGSRSRSMDIEGLQLVGSNLGTRRKAGAYLTQV
jgi:hypothetical protein